MARNHRVTDQDSATKFFHVPSNFWVRVIGVTRHKLHFSRISMKEYMIADLYLLAGPVLQDWGRHLAPHPLNQLEDKIVQKPPGREEVCYIHNETRFDNMATIAPEKPKTLQVALSTIAPLVVSLCALRITMVIGERYGMDTLPFVLVGWCAVLGVSATWLNRVVFRCAKTLHPFLAAILAILFTWSWQRQAFTRLVPRSGLTYGYFLTPAGAKARFWVLACPFWVGLTCLSVCLIVALVSGWRAGRRGLLACVIPWWVTAFLIFVLPSMYLDAQGNASVFI